MKKLLLLSLAIAPLMVAAQAFVGPRLQEQIGRSGSDVLPLVVTLNAQLDLEALRTQWTLSEPPVSERPRILLEALDAVSRPTQDALLTDLDATGIPFTVVRQLKIVNMLAISGSADLVQWLAEQDAVRSIILDESPYQLIEPVEMAPSYARDNSSEPGLTVIGAPEMWAMGYTGRGRLAYTVDTGIWPDHPALKKQWKGHRFPLAECWLPWDRLTPGDKASSHGTHVTGTILGLDSLTNDTIGAAFNAYFIAADPVVSNLADIRPLSDYAFTYEWCLNPDGDINTSSDVPDAINNSWGRQPDEESPYCDEEIIQMLDILELAGIANLSSAGNEGPAPMSMSVPHNINTNITNAFTVGSVNGNSIGLPISDFSSRGPSQCGGTGSLLIKPEVVAPGQSVRSAVDQDDYAFYSGTSMACPHAVGAFLLVKEAFPYLTGQQILEALYFSAADLGETGEDNTYGNGVINAFAAYNYLIDQGFTPEPPNQSPYDLVIAEVIAPAEGATCDNIFSPSILVKNAGQEPVEGFNVVFGILGEPELVVDVDEVLAPGQELTLDLPNYETDVEGSVEMVFRAEMYLDVPEIDPLNNQIIARFSIKNQEQIPFTETFEEEFLNAARWHLINPDLGKSWELFPTAGLLDSEQSVRMNLYDYGPNESQLDDLVGPRVAMPGSGEVYLAFDLAYQLRNGPPIIHDTLSVFVATECTLDNPQLVYKKGGETLSTFDVSTHDFVPDTGFHWRHEVIDISAYADAEFVLPIFQSHNRKGNNLYVDNVAIYQAFNPLSVGETSAIDLRLFPNPTSGDVMLRLPEVNGPVAVQIHDATGRLLQTHAFNATGGVLTLPTAPLPGGLYLVRVQAEDGVGVVRMVRE